MSEVLTIAVVDPVELELSHLNKSFLATIVLAVLLVEDFYCLFFRNGAVFMPESDELSVLGPKDLVNDSRAARLAIATIEVLSNLGCDVLDEIGEVVLLYELVEN